MSRPNSPELTIITGASDRYARCLWQFLRSAARHALPRTHRLVAYDLGLRASDRTRLAAEFPFCVWRDAPPLPDHAAVACQTYAWKPIVLHAAAAEFGGCILWLDSATIIQGRLDEPIRELDRHGVYLLAGQSALQDRCDPEVWRIAGAPLEILDLPERAAGVIGLDTRQPVARALLNAWHALALDARYWRPLSARHRPEQALLSILIYTAVRRGDLTLNPGSIDISCPHPVRWLTTRNKVLPSMPTWADPLVRTWYAGAKRADRVALRLTAWKRSRVDGWHRWTQEHYRVQVAERSGTHRRAIPAPAGSYYADPFLCRAEDRTWLFVEEFRYAHNAGRLVALPLDPDFRPGEPRVLQFPAGHLSFPFVFRHDGQWLMLPESSHRRTVDLFVCEAFPDRWRLGRRLLADIDAADSILVHRDERWWLFTSVRLATRGTGRALAVFHTDDLWSGEWVAHPMNAEHRWADQPHSYGRCAGPAVVMPDGALLRPIHASRRYYGECIEWRRIDTLTPDAFAETPVALADLAPTNIDLKTTHHVCIESDLIAWDHRDRIAGWRTR